jgi:hypothetical protein
MNNREFYNLRSTGRCLDFANRYVRAPNVRGEQDQVPKNPLEIIGVSDVYSSSTEQRADQSMILSFGSQSSLKFLGGIFRL